MVTLKTMVMMTKTLTSTTLICLNQNGSNNQRNYGNNNGGKYDKYYNDKDNHGIVQFRHPRSLLYDLSGSRVIVHWLGTSLGFISGLSR